MPAKPPWGGPATDRCRGRQGEGLRASRHDGVEHEHDEAVIGESSLAAPIADESGAVIAAVAIVFPSAEWLATDAVVNVLRETARNIIRELDSSWPPHK
ncbi:IclR family transcriptional regulator C-terminal domain-containing protein [Arthrobacter sp. ISL-30]|uniref:IclR family transcriptional regulator domain-containing protein n=1 Tax=Arthrobacter sp. ISL-30 TaxID=2819109 RepID=UPI001BEBF4DA|nr:IclR family transcriptional regulator C-terminal domain-containing protein [Arthrobacter sp. ISL-30]MBT2512990.1 hypothetical protein [Arthrobacter sp. ISL-30]